MANTIRKYNLTNCTSNINDSSIEQGTDIILTANDDFYFKDKPCYYEYTTNYSQYQYNRNNVQYSIPNDSLDIILTANEGYIFKDAPYCIDSEISDIDRIYFGGASIPRTIASPSVISLATLPSKSSSVISR